MTSISIKFIILNLIILWDTTHGLTGYYCEFPLEIGTVSLLDIEQCTRGTVGVMSDTYLQFLRIPQNGASDCDFDRYNILHEGMGKKLNGANLFYPTVFAGIMENVTFALRSTGIQIVCDRMFHTTEYSELLIYETSKKSSPARKRKTATDHIDIFMYVNEKFVYPNVILKDFALQMQLLYHDVLLYECYKEREKMKLALVSFNSKLISSDLFAYFLTKSRGYTVVARSEVAYIIKCVPVQVTIRKTKYCYNDLPVSYQNHNYFLTPITRILIHNGTKIDCKPKMPAKFFIDNKWYEVLPDPEIDEIETTESITTSISDLLSPFLFFYNFTVTLGYIIIGTIFFGCLFREEIWAFLI
ncbi:uncharacterized protein LOC115244838 [Formica exsecta]|uniref:uncharacterized protein LOC115244838 n=1 Tax=Formica exsecta TaxID=72781 RepID=UPI0011435950|nr:uncharacterized protein LOC115244838 [Formica exsecta]XP_029678694.1 uncharacterized protein LOC115244838 [Formica exsecta]